MTRQQIKELSKQQLGSSIFSNKWLMALVVCLIVEVIAAVAGTIPFAALIISGPFSFGVSYLFLKLVRTGQDIKIEDSFKGFTEDFGGNCVLGIMIAIFTFLWALLFIIPGIVKSYSYSMAFFIKVDHPDYDWKTCIKESMKMMDGHKMDLFIMDLSFIGWIIVGSCLCGIGLLWVEPYMQTARTNFYESIKGEVQNYNYNA